MPSHAVTKNLKINTKNTPQGKVIGKQEDSHLIPIKILPNKKMAPTMNMIFNLVAHMMTNHKLLWGLPEASVVEINHNLV